MSDQKPLFSIIMLTFDRPGMLKDAVEAFFAQTYSNWEAIIIDNASTPETQEYLACIERQDKRIKVVHFKTNQYFPDDPHKFVPVCFNAALDVARGDYVFNQADDDYISPDFVERMVALFQENPECTTVSARAQFVDINRKIIQDWAGYNYRPRYMPGHLLALETLKHKDTIMFNSSGMMFVVKRDFLVKSGGYPPSIEESHLYGIVPFGVTGYDERAVVYFRRHEGQLSASLLANGFCGLVDILALLKEWKIQEEWEARFGREKALFVVNTLLRHKYEVVSLAFVHVLYLGQWAGVCRLFSWGCKSWWFWKGLPYGLWNRKWVLKRTILNGLKKLRGDKS